MFKTNHSGKRRSTLAKRLLFLAVMVPMCLSHGCSRQKYRAWADRDAYRLLDSRQFDSRWDIPERMVAADPHSRLADVFDPDCEPAPPDDPAANKYMRQPYHSAGPVKYWDQRAVADSIESEHWLEHLPYNENGEIVFDKELTISLALLHSREFQSRVESLHTQALGLSASRYEYALNWFGGTSGALNANGDGMAANRALSHGDRIGVSRSLATGGQFAVNLVNSFTWQLGGSGHSNFGTGNLVFNLTQPLLRSAFRYVRTESLTQAERSLLYSVRDFARFRRQFYLDNVGRYLNLLNQTKSVQIAEENVRSLERNLEEHEILVRQGQVSPNQVDQVFQSYQQGRIGLINTQQSLQTAMDNFKFQLGLPARIKIKFDEGILEPFVLNSDELTSLQQDADALVQLLNQFLPPDEVAPEEFLDDVEAQLGGLESRLSVQIPVVRVELERWSVKLDRSRVADDDTDERIDHNQQTTLAKRIRDDFTELEKGPDDSAGGGGSDLKNEGEIDGDDEPVPPAVKRWLELQRRISEPGGLLERISILFGAQTKIRLFLIEIKPLDVEQEMATSIALAHRLDLMNGRATVMDSYRAVEIAANRLRSDLTVRASTNLSTDGTKNNAFRFDGKESQYNLGFEFDGPLNRMGERNAYRSSQILYQQQRRNYMAAEDAIVNAVRSDVRQLQTNRFSFQISRQSLVTAARQVEQTRLNVRSGVGNTSLTRDLLQALQQLRTAQNGLISSWIQYETTRISIFVDLELLLLDGNGNWINDRENLDEFIIDGIQESGRPQGNINGSDGAGGGPKFGLLTPAIEKLELEEPVPVDGN